MAIADVVPLMGTQEVIRETSSPSEGYQIHSVSHPKLNNGERVYLDLETGVSVPPCVLIGGNDLHVRVRQGVGELCMINLIDGERTDVALETPATVRDEAVIHTIEPGTLYWYKNTGEGPLILQDTCYGFELANEPNLEDVAQAVANVFYSARVDRRQNEAA